ncbi:MAG TPA: phosphoribosyltransferase family protein [Ohtaekwangia sp.]|nr:phosphoribosyltransferase family protein [Ohtaekwangia sp.]
MIVEGKTFMNRADAGFEVGKLLERRYKNTNALVVGIPRGGVPVAQEIAKVLNAEMSVLITKKLPHPLLHDLAVGAAAEDGSVFLTSSAQEIDRETLHKIHMVQNLEIKRRVERFRKGKPLPNIHNRVVIIADDGIATGSTIVPAIKMCRSRKAAKIIVAAPVSGRKYLNEINMLADEVVIAEQPDAFYAVSQAYSDFHSLTDEEVISVLETR